MWTKRMTPAERDERWVLQYVEEKVKFWTTPKLFTDDLKVHPHLHPHYHLHPHSHPHPNKNPNPSSTISA